MSSATATADGELAQLEAEVAAVVESFIQLGVSVHDYPGTTEATQGMVTNLRRNVDRVRRLNEQANTPGSVLHKVQVPLEVVQYIEDGRNPDVYTREFVEAIPRANQYQRGKMLAVAHLRDSLSEKIAQEFPQLSDSVADVVRRTTVPGRTPSKSSD
ncbi:mediator complex subunit NUT2 KNAG_0D05310 [Huiozyma naganishii CBS 8797]|uniref:Mediator of RNA polymerase II transcription subunit 10 n=1 Tax=Huiozyma naganishii (strain ATCC MYA-139 / BCRC 22969 / CBS 8797 / KCTC 17520 / NBRC 10181 / NCYC 3082 / Yp74L-3) TaxID=1071383 RepID=J7S694_HUIN7|nr:hypothetical protein KNAG_0D05310 [Kazachstania naganishii CBS 8797]CCK70269.1 hypothetical protein KNAG_0D05310 [Kazachstania naganishii CBS 8797]